ncbi:hypothetical protein FXW78_22625 [Rhodococcus opacus]|nr:hypothetical protein [Rhodococcus opacus]
MFDPGTNVRVRLKTVRFGRAASSFNADRLHSSIDYLSPIEYATRYREQRPTAASVLEVA